MSDQPKLPIKIFSDNFLRELFVAGAEQIISAYQEQDDAARSGKPVTLVCEATPSAEEQLNDKLYDAVGKLTWFIQKMSKDSYISCSACPALDFCEEAITVHRECHAVLKAWVRNEASAK